MVSRAFSETSGRIWSRAENFRESDECDDDEDGGSQRHNVVGKNEGLPWRARDFRRKRRQYGPWRHRLWNLQSRRWDRRNRRERRRQRRNGLRCGCGDRDGIEGRSDFGNGAAALGVTAEGVTHDVEKGLGKSVGTEWIRLMGKGQNGQM